MLPKEFTQFLALVDPQKTRSNYFFRLIRGGETQEFIAHPATIANDFNTLLKLNQAGFNIFMVVNPGTGFKDADIADTACLFIDWDGNPDHYDTKLKEVLDEAPTAIVHTSNGKFHAYWQVDQLPIHEFKATQQRLAKHFNSDKNVCNPARIMRVPGFQHVKDPSHPQPVTLTLHPQKPLTAQEVLARWAIQEPTPKKSYSGLDLGKLVSALKQLNADDYELWCKVGMALQHAELPYELWEEWSKTSPKFDPSVAEKKWDSFKRVTGDVVTLASVYFLAKEQGWIDTSGLDNVEKLEAYLSTASSQNATTVYETVFADGPYQDALLYLRRNNKRKFQFLRNQISTLTGLAVRDLNELLKHSTSSFAKDEEQARIEAVKDFGFLCGDELVISLLSKRTMPRNGFNVAVRSKTPKLWTAAILPFSILQDLASNIFDGETYDPSAPGIVTIEHSTHTERLVNLYIAPELPEPHYNEQDEKLFEDHLFYLSGEDVEFQTYLLNWMAYMIQFPGKRINTAPVIIGPQGNGKTFLMDVLTALLGASNTCIVTTDELASNFQDNLAFKQLRCVEEIKVYDEQLTLMDRLKPWITNDTVALNRKYRKTTTVTNCGNWLFLSNEESALKLSHSDRRYQIAISRTAPRPTTYYETLFSTFHPPSGGSVASLLYMLQHRDLSRFKAKAPSIRNLAFYEMMEASYSEAEIEAKDALESLLRLNPERGFFTSEELRATLKNALSHGGLSNHKFNRFVQILQLQRGCRLRTQHSVLNIHTTPSNTHWNDASATTLRDHLTKHPIRYPIPHA